LFTIFFLDLLSLIKDTKAKDAAKNGAKKTESGGKGKGKGGKKQEANGDASESNKKPDTVEDKEEKVVSNEAASSDLPSESASTEEVKKGRGKPAKAVKETASGSAKNKKNAKGKANDDADSKESNETEPKKDEDVEPEDVEMKDAESSEEPIIASSEAPSDETETKKKGRGGRKEKTATPTEVVGAEDKNGEDAKTNGDMESSSDVPKVETNKEKKTKGGNKGKKQQKEAETEETVTTEPVSKRAQKTKLPKANAVTDGAPQEKRVTRANAGKK